MEKDPVCGMSVDPQNARGEYEYKGVHYYFCALKCRDKFKADPEHYLNPEPQSREIEDASLKEIEFTCPMHPEIVQKGPGACPICGMALEPKSGGLTSSEPNPELVDFTRRFWVSALFTLPLFILSMSGMGSFAIVEGVLATPVVLWAGFPFFERAWASLKSGHWNMFTLIGIGTGVAYFYSVIAALFPEIFPDAFRGVNGEAHVYFESSAMIVTLVLLGQVLELKARAQTSSALKSLLKLQPVHATRVHDSVEEDVALKEVRAGDLLKVKAGEQVPVDGVITQGRAVLDESMLTGESIPVERGEKDSVIGGTTNQTGVFLMRATGVGENSMLSRIVNLVAEAQRSRAPIQSFADRVSEVFVPVVIVVAMLTAVAWLLWGPEPRGVFALLNALAVLLIACPCALGLATPMSIMVGMGRAAHAGVLIRKAEALEVLEKIDTLILDKTGTLTEGKPSVRRIVCTSDVQEDKLLQYAASLESNSEHPLAQAVLKKAAEKGLSLLKVEQYETRVGRGALAHIGGIKVALGNDRLMQEIGASLKEGRFDEDTSATRIYAAFDEKIVGIFELSDPLKEGAKETLERLRARGIQLVLLSGDRKSVVQKVAETLNIDLFYAEVLPEDKLNWVKKFQKEGHRVAMAGDGINDAPALAVSDVGIAMGTGTDVAMQSADVTLVHGDIRAIERAFLLSKAILRNIRQNLFFAFFYNALGVPLAAGLFYPFFGILLSPMLASAAMSFSSVSVIGNALRLKWVKL